MTGGTPVVRRRLWWLVAVVAVALGACSEPEADSSGPDDTDNGAIPASDACEGDALLDCARASSIGPLVPDGPVAADGEPIVLGMVNQENTPGGSYPELSQATTAAIDFVNEQLGGIDGRPVELEVCNTDFSAEGSTSCGQRFVDAGVPVVLGGIDVFGGAIEVLADNDVPYAGGIPISTPSVQSPNSFQWSGGTWGATVAFAEHASTELEAERVSIVYGEFGSIAESAEYAQHVLEASGVSTQLVPYPILAADVASPLQAAATSDPDAVFLLAADTGCKAAFDALRTLDLQAQKYFVGACAAPSIIDSVDTEATDGTIFNVEGPVTEGALGEVADADVELYNAVVTRYGDGLNPVGAGTVSFRSFMNLWAVLVGLGADGLDAPSIDAALRAQVDTPSFMGHPYTCDGEQFEGLPAICSPQQVLAQMEDRELTQLGGWVDVGEIYGASS
jgi:branched-chain amino acid transport system substrate-binding protein